MGTLITTSIMIKLLLTSSLLALTAAEADPQVLAYSGLPYAAALPAAVPALHPVGAVAHAPVVKSEVIKPAEVSHEVAAAPIVTYAHPLGYYGKRSADAEPQAEADAYYGYGYGYGYGHYRGYNRGYYGHPYAYYGKRSADAEPAVLGGGSRVLTAPTPFIHNAPALPAVTYAAHPLGYAVPYAGLHYGVPVVAPAAPAAAEAVVAERKKREADPQVLLSGLSYAAPHAPVVKNVEVTPAEVSHEVTAHTVPVAVGYHG